MSIRAVLTDSGQGRFVEEQRHNMETQLLAARDLAKLVEIVGRDQFMDLMIDRLRARFADHDRERCEVRVRDGFRYDKPALGLLEWMPTHELGGPVVIKMVGYHPTNPTQRGVPSVLATSSLWDTESGHLVAIADATFLTAVRTGAASGLATEILAVDRPVEIGLVGLGAQAVTQLHAISRVRKISRVLAFDVSSEATSSFADRVSFVDAPVSLIEPGDLDGLVAESDVIVTCTSVDIGTGPVIPDVATRPWVHVNAVGADFPGKTELPVELLRRSTVIPDSREQCLAEGECQVLDPADLGPELAQLVMTEKNARGYCRSSATVFDSTGWAVEDDVALRLALELAEENGLGMSIQIESISEDPLDPYDLTA